MIGGKGIRITYKVQTGSTTWRVQNNRTKIIAPLRISDRRSVYVKSYDDRTTLTYESKLKLNLPNYTTTSLA